jgi:hypothetical protein
MIFSRSSAFCDWLDVTCSPERSFLDYVERFLDVGCYPVAFSSTDKERGTRSTSYRVGEGMLRLDVDRKYHRASASGAVLSHLRSCGQYGEFLSTFATAPHTITRLDAAVDTSQDFPRVLRTLRAFYPAGLVSFSRKALKITELLGIRASDGVSTGTWYAGHRAKAMVTARVYDKQQEILDKTGIYSETRTRYEFTFRKGMGVTLRDASMPESLFYHHAQKLGLSPPGEVAPWTSHDLGGWEPLPVSLDFSFAQLVRRVESSPELAHLAELCSKYGPTASGMVLRAFEKALSRHVEATAGDDLHGERCERADRPRSLSTG